MDRLRNKAKNFPGTRKIDNPRAKQTTLRAEGTINMKPKEKIIENR